MIWLNFSAVRTLHGSWAVVAAKTDGTMDAAEMTAAHTTKASLNKRHDDALRVAPCLVRRSPTPRHERAGKQADAMFHSPGSTPPPDSGLISGAYRQGTAIFSVSIRSKDQAKLPGTRRRNKTQPTVDLTQASRKNRVCLACQLALLGDTFPPARRGSR